MKGTFIDKGLYKCSVLACEGNISFVFFFVALMAVIFKVLY